MFTYTENDTEPHRIIQNINIYTKKTPATRRYVSFFKNKKEATNRKYIKKKKKGEQTI